MLGFLSSLLWLLFWLVVILGFIAFKSYNKLQGHAQAIHEGSSNIQVADLNALNAVMAVIKWKKIRGFYRDLEHEHHSTYTTDGNMLLNSDCN